MFFPHAQTHTLKPALLHTHSIHAHVTLSFLCYQTSCRFTYFFSCPCGFGPLDIIPLYSIAIVHNCSSFFPSRPASFFFSSFLSSCSFTHPISHQLSHV